MNTLLKKVDKLQLTTDWSKVSDQQFLIFRDKRKRIHGLVLSEHLVGLDDRDFYSFRVKKENFWWLRLELFSLRLPVGEKAENIRSRLEDYFSLNEDNPVAVQHTMNCIRREPIDDLTQYPPLQYDKSVDRLDDLIKQANPGDILFTFDNSSGISKLVRTYDRGMWSHVGIIGSDGLFYHTTTSGMKKDSIESLYSESCDLGLYRLKIFGDDVDSKFATTLQNGLESDLKRIVGYDWILLFKMFLRRRFRIKITNKLTPAQMLYGNTLRLVAYC